MQSIMIRDNAINAIIFHDPLIANKRTKQINKKLSNSILDPRIPCSTIFLPIEKFNNESLPKNCIDIKNKL